MHKIIFNMVIFTILHIPNINICAERFPQQRRFDNQTQFDTNRKIEPEKEKLCIPSRGLFIGSDDQRYKARNTQEQDVYLDSHSQTLFPLALESCLIKNNNEWYVGVISQNTISYRIPVEDIDLLFQPKQDTSFCAIDNQGSIYKGKIVESEPPLLKTHNPPTSYFLKWYKEYPNLISALGITAVAGFCVVVWQYADKIYHTNWLRHSNE